MTRTDINQATPCITLKKKKIEQFESAHSHATTNAGYSGGKTWKWWRAGDKKGRKQQHCGGHGTLKNAQKPGRERDQKFVTTRENAIFAMTYLPFLKDFIIVWSPVNCNTGIRAKGSWWTKKWILSVRKSLTNPICSQLNQLTVVTLNFPAGSKLKYLLYSGFEGSCKFLQYLWVRSLTHCLAKTDLATLMYACQWRFQTSS